MVITADTGLWLGRYFGVSAQSWMNLQAHYELKMAELDIGARLNAEPILGLHNAAATNGAHHRALSHLGQPCVPSVGEKANVLQALPKAAEGVPPHPSGALLENPPVDQSVSSLHPQSKRKDLGKVAKHFHCSP